MDEEDENGADPTPLRANLQALIDFEDGGSVNAWANRHKLVQTTVNRIVKKGMQPTTRGVAELAQALGLQPWQLLAPNLGAGLHRMEGMTMVPVYRPPAGITFNTAKLIGPTRRLTSGDSQSRAKKISPPSVPQTPVVADEPAPAARKRSSGTRQEP